jgi:hypothetical protein
MKAALFPDLAIYRFASLQPSLPPSCLSHSRHHSIQRHPTAEPQGAGSVPLPESRAGSRQDGMTRAAFPRLRCSAGNVFPLERPTTESVHPWTTVETASAANLPVLPLRGLRTISSFRGWKHELELELPPVFSLQLQPSPSCVK